MRNTLTVTIGIPAYNEAANIQGLLKRLLGQIEDGFRLEKILVLSDGSTDSTIQEVSRIKDRRVTCIDEDKRLGKSARLDQLFRMSTSDVLILLDADIIFSDNKLLSKFFKRIDLRKNGLATVNVQPLFPETFFEHCLDAGVAVTKGIAEKWNNADNYLTYKGCFLALDKALVKKLHLPAEVVNNDAYIYFAAKKLGYTPQYTKAYRIYYRSPTTLTDHIKQSSRYQHSRNELAKYFTDLDSSYQIPVAIMGKSVLESLVKRPVYFVSYLAIYGISKIKRQVSVKNTWSIATSTKQAVFTKPR